MIKKINEKENFFYSFRIYIFKKKQLENRSIFDFINNQIKSIYFIDVQD